MTLIDTGSVLLSLLRSPPSLSSDPLPNFPLLPPCSRNLFQMLVPHSYRLCTHPVNLIISGETGLTSRVVDYIVDVPTPCRGRKNRGAARRPIIGVSSKPSRKRDRVVGAVSRNVCFILGVFVATGCDFYGPSAHCGRQADQSYCLWADLSMRWNELMAQ